MKRMENTGQMQKLKITVPLSRLLERYKVRSDKYKTKAELALLGISIGIPVFLASLYSPYWMAATLTAYLTGGQYYRLRDKVINYRSEYHRNTVTEFCEGEFMTEVVASPIAYGILRHVSNEGTANYISAVIASYFTARIVGIPTWAMLYYESNKDKVNDRGRLEVLKEKFKQWCWIRKYDWWLLAGINILPLIPGLIFDGPISKDNFKDYGIAKTIILGSICQLCIQPFFYDKINRRENNG
ncbi:MAG: hypothetical protein Q7S22_09090 [Candidatus Micrarchaeota archaeon]|nr:hypothetical protein [Candidatus Micrarchaeota archaeon]